MCTCAPQSHSVHMCWCVVRKRERVCSYGSVGRDPAALPASPHQSSPHILLGNKRVVRTPNRPFVIHGFNPKRAINPVHRFGKTPSVQTLTPFLSLTSPSYSTSHFKSPLVPHNVHKKAFFFWPGSQQCCAKQLTTFLTCRHWKQKQNSSCPLPPPPPPGLKKRNISL